ncbi:MAG: pyridoxal phosphate-dependent decarboxylase family protein, partial [Actinomycetes bacterium]
MSRPLSLGDQREPALEHAAELVARAWREFDTAREEETVASPELLARLHEPLPEEPGDVIADLDLAGDVLDASLAQSRPRYLAYIGSSGLEVGALADLLAHSYDINLALDARAATQLERQAIEWLAAFLGFPATSGSFTSGGMISNITALAAARERALPGSRSSGMANRRAAFYCSAEAHYSVTRAAELLGVGRDNVRDIAIDSWRRMDPAVLAERLDADIAAGITPIAVVATAGTTLTGAVDPIDAIVDVCHQRGVWVHVDGAYGLPAAGALTTAPRFVGLDRVDSLAVDAHKWMFVPKACSAVLVRHTADLAAAFSHNEAYIPQEDDELNAVDVTLEYSRPLRALKLWLALRVHGAAAFRTAIEGNLAQAQLLYGLAAAHPEFQTR